MSNHFGYCPKCKKMKALTEHHVYPKRFFGENKSSLYICRECHDDIELIIPLYKQLDKKEYVRIVTEWLAVDFYCKQNRHSMQK